MVLLQDVLLVRSFAVSLVPFLLPLSSLLLSSCLFSCPLLPFSCRPPFPSRFLCLQVDHENVSVSSLSFSVSLSLCLGTR